MSFTSDDLPPSTPVSEPRWRLPEWFTDLDNQTLTRLKEYHGELLRFNKSINLISPRTVDNADLIHFADSIYGARAIAGHWKGKSIFDIGSGNGFPGLVLALLCPNQQVILLDSDRRKVEFLKHTAAKMKLANVDFLNLRLEDLKPGQVETAVSRGFAPMQKIMRLARVAVKPGGAYYLFKSDAWGTEVLGTPVQVGRYWSPSLLSEYSLPKVSIKLALVLMERTKAT